MLDVGQGPVTGKRRQKVEGWLPHSEGGRGRVADLAASVDAGRYVERSTRTVGGYLDEWLEVVPPRLRPTSRNSHRQAGAHIKGWIGAVPEVRNEMIDLFHEQTEVWPSAVSMPAPLTCMPS